MKNYLIVALLFLLSVAIRVPNLNRPISKHHEFNTAFFLIPMEIWQQEGIATYGFIPPYNYPNANDKFIAEPIGIEEGNKNGTYYYLSFPSLSYIVPYAIFSIFNLNLTALSLQVFNLILHLVVCSLLYRIFSNVFTNNSALLGVMFYMFSAGTLWFHGNGYTHHIFAVFLIVLTLYFLTKIVFDNKPTKVNYSMFALSLILLFLTEWISVFFAFVLVIFSIVNFKKYPAHKILVLLTVFSGVLSALVLFIQYSFYFGWQEYLDYQLNRFSYRSTLVNDSLSVGEQIFSWVKWTIVSFGAWMLLMGSLLFMLVKMKDKLRTSHNEKLLFTLLFFPPFFYHIVFMEFTVVHDYSVIIDGLFWSFLLAFLVDRLKLPTSRLYIFASVVIVFSVAQYYVINRPGKYNQNGDLYSIYQDIGEVIKATSTSDDTIFITGFDESVNQNNPQIIYYAKRNFKPVNNELDAQIFMQEFNRQSAKLYILDKGKVVQIKSLTLSDTF